MRTVSFYETTTGRKPVEDFLDSLNGKQAQKVVWVLKLIEELDVVPQQYFKKLINTNDLWEVRVQSGGDIFRLLGFFDGTGHLVVLTNGFAKKSQKTPPQEIRLAEQRKADWLSRRNRSRSK